MSTRIHVAQLRLQGPTEGLRVHRICPGRHRWLLRIMLTHANGDHDRRDIVAFDPCTRAEMVDVYHREIDDLCQPIAGQPPHVTAGGFDLYLLKPTDAALRRTLQTAA